MDSETGHNENKNVKYVSLEGLKEFLNKIIEGYANNGPPDEEIEQ